MSKNYYLKINLTIKESHIQKSLFHLLVNGKPDVKSIIENLENIYQISDMTIILTLKDRLVSLGLYGVYNWHDDVFGEFGMDENELNYIYEKIKHRLYYFDWSLLDENLQ